MLVNVYLSNITMHLSNVARHQRCHALCRTATAALNSAAPACAAWTVQLKPQSQIGETIVSDVQTATQVAEGGA